MTSAARASCEAGTGFRALFHRYESARRPGGASRRREARAARALVLAALLFPMASSAATVVLDVGHTPKRPGSTSASGIPEFAFNARMGRIVAARLRAHGVTVVASGPLDRDLGLAERTRATARADLFVSLHHDSIQQAWIDAGRRREFAGFSVFVSGKNPHPGTSRTCAATVGRALAAAGERPSGYHALPVAGENRPLLDARAGVHRFDDLVVLKTSRAPALLVEFGVIANPDEDARLARPEVAQRLGDAVADAIAGCLQRP